jgi:broad specificity polyphosphatase/5'/3'-nucleotidase SurE
MPTSTNANSYRSRLTTRREFKAGEVLQTRSVARALKARILLVFLVICASEFGETEAKDSSRPRILVTNPEGSKAAGFAKCIQILAKEADVFFSIPSTNKHSYTATLNSLAQEPSDDGSSFKAGRSFELKRTSIGGVSGWTINGSPSDVAEVAIGKAGNDGALDLLLSFTAHGVCVGYDLRTCSAVHAAEVGVNYAIPSIVFHMHPACVNDGCMEKSLALVLQVLEKIRAGNGWPKDLALSVCAPHHPKTVIETSMGSVGLKIVAIPDAQKNDTEVTPSFNVDIPAVMRPGTDLHHHYWPEASPAGAITITPIKVDWTATEALPVLKSWNLKINDGATNPAPPSLKSSDGAKSK